MHESILTTLPSGYTLVDNPGLLDQLLLDRSSTKNSMRYVDTSDEQRKLGGAEQLLYSHHEVGGTQYTLVEESGVYFNSEPTILLGHLPEDKLLLEYSRDVLDPSAWETAS